MARITIRKKPNAPGFYIVSSGGFGEVTVAGKARALEIANARKRVLAKRKKRKEEMKKRKRR